MKLFALNKPFGMMCQFSEHPTRPTLAACIQQAGVYPAGRLDADSEGLLLLTDDGTLQAKISEPRHKLAKTYWAQVEGQPSAEALSRLRGRLDLGDFVTQACVAEEIPEPTLWPRDPPIRFRANIPTTWLAITLTEGKNRQVRRMTAAIGHPTLRLVRVQIGDLNIFDLGLQPGVSVAVQPDQLGNKFLKPVNASPKGRVFSSTPERRNSRSRKNF